MTGRGRPHQAIDQRRPRCGFDVVLPHVGCHGQVAGIGKDLVSSRQQILELRRPCVRPIEDRDGPGRDEQVTGVAKEDTAQRMSVMTILLEHRQPGRWQTVLEDRDHRRREARDRDRLAHGVRHIEPHRLAVDLGLHLHVLHGHRHGLNAAREGVIGVLGLGPVARSGGCGHCGPCPVGLRHDALRHRRADDRPDDMSGLREVGDERHRVARDHRDLDVDQIRAGGVVDDGPTLQIGVPIIGQDQTIGAFPNGHGPHIGQPDRAGAQAGQADPDIAFVLHPGPCDGLQSGVQILLHRLVLEADRGDLAQVDPAETVGTGKTQEGALRTSRVGFDIDADDPARDRVGRRDRHALTPRLAQQSWQVEAAVEVDRIAGQDPLQRIPRREADGRCASARVAHDQAAEQVVDILLCDRQRDLLSPVDLALVREIAHAMR